MVLLDPEGVVVGWLAGAEYLFGYSVEEMVGKRLDVLFTPEDRERGVPEHELEIARANGRALDDRWQMRKDGTRFWASGAVVQLRNEDGTAAGFAKMLRDRTDLKAQLEAAERRADTLGATDRRKTLFLATVAHELRSPLQSLMHAVELLRIGPLGEQAAGPVRTIERQVELMTRLVEDLLDLSRLSAGKVKLQPCVVDLNEVLQRAADTVRPATEKRRQQFHVLLLPARVELEADPDRLHQVFVNLLSNAIKYTPEGGKVWLKATVEGEEAVARVEDNGVGIAPEMLPRIFELFTQEETSRPMDEGGLGLGLSLVQELVSLHRGTVQVRSEGKDKGSELTVRLPLRRSPPLPEPGVPS